MGDTALKTDELVEIRYPGLDAPATGIFIASTSTTKGSASLVLLDGTEIKTWIPTKYIYRRKEKK